MPLTGGVPVAIPKPGDAQRRAVCPGEPGGHCFAETPVWLEDRIGRDDAVLSPTPGIAEGEGVGDAVVASVEG